MATGNNRFIVLALIPSNNPGDRKKKKKVKYGFHSPADNEGKENVV